MPIKRNGTKQTHFKPSNKLSRCIQMATLQVKNREKLPHGIMGRLHNPPFTLAEYNLQPNKAKQSWMKLPMSRPLFVGSSLQVTWWAPGQ